jgi:hypothetical protein
MPKKTNKYFICKNPRMHAPSVSLLPFKFFVFDHEKLQNELNMKLFSYLPTPPLSVREYVTGTTVRGLIITVLNKLL